MVGKMKMGNYTYKCVPVPTVVEIGKNKHLDAIQGYEDEIRIKKRSCFELAP